VVTAEIGPPKGINIDPVIAEARHSLSQGVTAVNVTDIQTAVMRAGSLVGCKLLIDVGIEPVLQMVTRDRNRLALQSDLLSAYILGVRNVLALTGDHVAMGDHPEAKIVYDLDSVGLLAAMTNLEAGHDLGRDLKGKPNELDGAPAFFKGCCVTPCAQEVEPQVIKLAKKVAAGAQFVQTQAVYDPAAFESFMKLVEKYGIKVPILVGIVLLKNAGMAKYMNKSVPGVSVPEPIIQRLSDAAKADRQKVAVDIAAELVAAMKPMCQGAHLMTLGWDHCVPQIVAQAGITVAPPAAAAATTKPAERAAIQLSDFAKDSGMGARLIDGEPLAQEMQQKIAVEAAELTAKGRKPRLVAVQVGENPASKIYTNMQAKNCESVGIEYQLLNLPAEMMQEELLARLAELGADHAVTGIILQMPLPPQINARTVQAAIDWRKDVEGLHPANLGRLLLSNEIVAPCTAKAAVELLKRTCPDLAGKETVVVGHSEIVGKPVAALLLQSLNASPTVTVCHVATKDLAAHTRRAEVLIVATGVSQARWLGYQRRRKAGEAVSRPDLSPIIKADMLREGAIVIDVAINRIPRGLDGAGEPLKNAKGKPDLVTVGDVDFQGALSKVAAITPVPGGVGPVTVAMLLANTLACAKALA
jgi:5,10-methylene-tetrahydrofolate dehydrogenase/methenyl tetrahydrofolate cyclohydrolase/5,10-methylenetetrahydrofolate reductase